ncbi:hypothetical protein ACIPUC_14605 [Streptomyces sp. LARHCF249]
MLTAVNEDGSTRDGSLIDEIVREIAGSRAAGLAMVFKLIESAQARWQTVNAPHIVGAGVRFTGGFRMSCNRLGSGVV